jgi:hypothetical protein
MVPGPLQAAAFFLRPLIEGRRPGLETLQELADIKLLDVAWIAAIDGCVDLPRI